MADPLRRTLLAKLRGKKSKKGTPAGGFSVAAAAAAAAANGGNREDLIENVRSSSVGHREQRVIKYNEANKLRPPVNSITVSKKRNWLEQSSHKPQSHEECATATEDDCGHVANPSSPENPRQSGTNATLPAGQGVQTVHITMSPTLTCLRMVDPAEENDADDEGDIWYNPIPEDEEPELPQGLCPAARCKNSQALHTVVPVSSPSKLSNGDSVKGLGSITAGSSPSSSQILRDCQAVPTSQVNLANSVHSTERLQLHRQMFACKPGRGAAIEENPAPKPSAAVTGPTDGTYKSDPGFSPPSSPNPLKKGGSINWSFPDKIKSPRTVRKLSMKMKKLPELSRKLSVKGTSSSSHPEPRPASPKSNGSSSGTDSAQGPPLSPGNSTAASRNVISRYHLDSSVSTQHSYKKKNDTEGSKSASKGGYLSDGDSPELVAKSGSKVGKSKEPPTNNHKVHVTEIDIDAFRHYSFADKPKCLQYISGLMSVHFYGAEDLKPPRIDSREVYCAIQVDSVNKARTALLTCKTTFLDMDHTFNIELENAQHLKLVVFSWEPTPRRNRVCCHGTVVLPTLFRVTRTHQLAVKLEPRGKIYVKLNLMEQWQNSLDSLGREREPAVFGVEAWKLVEKENAGIMVPLLIEKCITEIENRGCQVVGLYRLCGSAAVKKELREAFERDSKAVELSENQYPDINVITGVLKDYLRELPFPLITKQLYEAVLDAMIKRPLRIGPNGCENEQCDSEYTVSLLEHLPEVEKVTLRMLLDHLKRVASYHEVNKMNCQNLAVCFGPVLLSQRQEASHHSNRVFIDSEELASALDFKKHIEVLHYLLQLWPVVDSRTKDWPASHTSAEQPANALCLRRRQRPRPCMLDLSSVEMAGVLRPRQGRLDSSSNRYARDWSTMGESYFQPLKENAAADEADYDDVPSEDPESEEEAEEEGGSKMEGLSDHILTPLKSISKEHTYQAYMEIQEINPALNHPVNLKDLQESIDTLIGNLERELNKNKLNVGY
ncbi:rho GTPase-activating protein SYDE2 isoform X2 [Acipenser ruthenus]|uniref:rho GTPase-activating protein SYDE2 isoform X2 n=1 Tax=Acipenser ruthenus TaxID=7906 RepID=UPI002741D30A|nr:rho GTPase-activating protein SYDE2 isoform X2 [Acipenser ruthenus]